MDLDPKRTLSTKLINLIQEDLGTLKKNAIGGSEFDKLLYLHLYKAIILFQGILKLSELEDYVLLEIIARSLFMIALDSCYIFSEKEESREALVRKFFAYHDKKKYTYLNVYTNKGVNDLEHSTVERIEKLYRKAYAEDSTEVSSDWCGHGVEYKAQHVTNCSDIFKELDIQKFFFLAYDFFYRTASDNSHTTSVNFADIFNLNPYEEHYFEYIGKGVNENFIRTFDESFLFLCLVYLNPIIYNSISTREQEIKNLLEEYSLTQIGP